MRGVTRERFHKAALTAAPQDPAPRIDIDVMPADAAVLGFTNRWVPGVARRHHRRRRRRPEIVSDVAAASSGVREHIAREIQALLDSQDFVEALPGFLLPDGERQARRPLLEEPLRGGVT